MARKVLHEEDGPLRVDEDDLDEEYGDIAICQCGLSDDRPFCDGSHRVTEDEADGVVYEYAGDSPDGERRIVEERD